jgi:hypothetical protein
MVCEKIVQRYKVQTDQPIDLRLMERGVRLLRPEVMAEIVSLDGERFLELRSRNLEVSVSASSDGFECAQSRGDDAEAFLKQAYAVATQEAALRRLGYAVSMEREGSKVRMRATR